MTGFRHLIIFASAAFLTACFPAKEITQENAESMLAATSRISQVSAKTVEGFTSSQINNRSLQRLLTSSARTLTGECHANQGSYLFSQSEESNFSMVFDNCTGADNSKVDGTLNGTLSHTDDRIEIVATGDFVSSRNNNLISFKPIELTFSFNNAANNRSIMLEHSGTYGFNTRLYKGDVTVETLEAVGYDFETQIISGVVQYTDASSNTLKVEHDNNGVHLSFNNTYFTSYSHSEWTQKFN